jgi:phosphoribosylglycinamide formyltransferase-1
VTGCTVHRVSAEVDGGPFIDQAKVDITTHETFDSLAEKIHAAEHALLPAVIARLSRGSS